MGVSDRDIWLKKSKKPSLPYISRATLCDIEYPGINIPGNDYTCV